MSPSAEPTFIPSVSHVPTVSSFPSMAPSSYKSTTWFKDIVSKSKWGCTPLPEPVPVCTSVTDWENLRAIMEQEEGVVIFCPFEVVKTNSTYPPITLKHEATFLCATNNQCIISGGGTYNFIHEVYCDTNYHMSCYYKHLRAYTLTTYLFLYIGIPLF